MKSRQTGTRQCRSNRSDLSLFRNHRTPLLVGRTQIGDVQRVLATARYAQYKLPRRDTHDE